MNEGIQPLFLQDSQETLIAFLLRNENSWTLCMSPGTYYGAVAVHDHQVREHSIPERERSQIWIALQLNWTLRTVYNQIRRTGAVARYIDLHDAGPDVGFA